MTTISKPGIGIRDGTPADTSQLIDLFYEAFAEDAVTSRMHPNGVTTSAKEKFGLAFSPPGTPSKEPGPGPNGEQRKKPKVIVKVVETLPSDQSSQAGAGEIIAFSLWTLYNEPREEWDWDMEIVPTVESFGEGVDLEVANDFIGGLKRKDRQHLRGDRHLMLNILATSSKHRGLGAGSALVRWGTEFADKEGLPAFLNASPKGYPVYKKAGFEPIDVQDLNLRERWNVADDGTDWGKHNAVELYGPLAEGCWRTVVMKKLPRKGKE
ncbi:N-acetyltransferase-like protein [Thozetella sp. PMI_491]|nr:N-acetyltransferase-like protein [Thozetella sp. PMI_491]